MAEKTNPTAVVTKPERPAIPEREPKDNADWLVIVRHSPILPSTLTTGKGIVVQASSRAEAWKKFLTEAEAAIRAKDALYRREPGSQQRALEWLRQAKLEIPEGAECIGLEYVEARKKALRVKGTVSVEQIGFPELASV